MAKHPYAEIYNQLIPEVLEQHAFVFTDIVDHDEALASNPGGSAISAEVEFRNGAQKGYCRLIAPVELCVSIAANVLGCEPDDEMAINAAADAFKEVANVCTGHVLTQVFGIETTFDILAPYVSNLNEDQWQEALEQPDQLYYLADDFPVLLKANVTTC